MSNESDIVPLVKKLTPGTVEQLFDLEGNLLGQKFIAAHEDIEYLDENDELLSNNDDGNNFYAPFDMVQPEGY